MKIKKRDGTETVLYEAKGAADIRAAVEAAVKARANLYGANLSRANLSRANLSRANLSGIDLSGADLSGIDLYGANLYGANLSGADLYEADLYGANLYGANLTRANLSRANLYGADLYGADLYGANLYGANLSGADLSRAKLYGANLYRADLSRAKGFSPERIDDLRILLDQVGKIRAYKLVTADLKSPINGRRISYEIGSTVKAKASTDESEQCGPGINVATLPWCLKNWQTGHRVLLVEFTRKDIAAIPHATDGKFRCHKVKVIREVDVESILREEGD